MDANLTKYINKYDRWLEEKTITVSSRVIPVNESIRDERHILPSAQALEILRQARLITLAECTCRKRYRNCDKPLEVCFILNETGEKWMADGRSRPVSLETAETILKEANKHGLVHMTLYQPDHEIFAFCSCCACCCHDLQLVLTYGKDYIISRSDYTVLDDPDRCTACGICVERCEFGARTVSDDGVCLDPDRCYGCGLCVTTCPEDAIKMVAAARVANPG